ncbi:MAG: imidazoleglycerol-phosphate dehydratase HisB [Verrucomicrobiaceae bacterium]|nr:imidazoleglycerol-phosphate dehydratase HisB [Verrucomicrobiaceae bacterium]
MKNRTAKIIRNTKETQIELELNLDGSGKYDIETGIPFFNHMLELFTRHGIFDLTIRAKGDIEIDYHHTVEDVGIVLGQAFKQAVGDKAGMNRYGFFILPMDETLVRVAVDLSNRPILVYDLGNSDGRVRDFNVSLCKEFFQAFANEAGANLHVKLEYGDEPHHIAEGAFKCFAKALNNAVAINPRMQGQIPSTKGSI